MLVVLLFFTSIAGSAFAAPSRVKRFDVFDQYPFPFASPFRTYAGFGFPPAGFWPPFQWYPIPMPDFSKFVAWYKGQNVCVTKKVLEEPEEIREWFTDGFDDNYDFAQKSENCRGNNDKYVCMGRIQTNEGSKMEMTKYECCYGFVRPTDMSPGCVENKQGKTSGAQEPSGKSAQVQMREQYKYNVFKGKDKIDLRYLMPTLRNMGATQMVKLVERVGMLDDFHNNNYTVFCPPNSALEIIQNEIEDEIDNEITSKTSKQNLKKKTHLYKIVTSHLSPDFIKADDMVDGKILSTDNPTCEIRINVYFTPIRIITANCVPIMAADNFARNGIVHVVEKVLPMPTKTVADIIAGDTQFSILKRMLSLAGLVQTLRNPNGSFTMFAPTDSAFKSTLQYQNGERDNRCTVSLMKHHIVDHVVCSAALPIHARSLNMIGELLSLSRDSNNKLYVDDVQVVVRDLMATNGVVHIIDGVLSAQQTKPVTQVLDEFGLYEFLSLIESADLKLEFDSLENVTFFIPADEVLQTIPPRHLDALLKYNNHSLQEILRFHVVEGQSEMKFQDQILKSKLGNSSIRFQVYKKYPQLTPQLTAQCATVLNADIKLCGGTLHVIDKLLFPPKLTIIEFLESIEGFSTLVLLLRVTGLARKLKSIESSYTLFAPTDDAFYQMGEEVIFRILENTVKATDLVKMHLMQGSVCCSQLNNNLLSGRHQARTMEGSLLNLDRSIDGNLMAGGAHVVDCDIVATNGVIHMVDAVLSHDQSSYLGRGFLENLFMLV